MLHLDIPGRGSIDLEHLVLDLNGTIAIDGVVSSDVAQAISDLKNLLHPVILTADTHGNASDLQSCMGVDIYVIERGHETSQKRDFIEMLGAPSVIAIGNGSNDAEMLRVAAIGICVLGREGTAVETIGAADLVVQDILAVFEMLHNPERLITTLRS